MRLGKGPFAAKKLELTDYLDVASTEIEQLTYIMKTIFM